MRYNLLYAAVLYTGSNTNRVPAADVTIVKNSNKLYVSSISTGEAEYYRSYWQSNWAGARDTKLAGQLHRTGSCVFYASKYISVKQTKRKSI